MSAATDIAQAADKWLRRFRATLVAILGVTVGGIGALAFWTSFEAIKQYAHGSGGIDPRHDFAVPLLVDSFIVVATGADLWFATTTKAQRRHLWTILWPKALLAGAAGVSFTLNVAHAKAGDWAARGVAAIPPVALVLSIELLMLVVRRATALRTERLEVATAPVKRARQAAAKQVAAQAPAAVEQQPGLRALPRPARKAGAKPTSTRGKVRQHLEQQRAAGAERPSTAELMRVAVERFGATRGGALRALVLDAWPEGETAGASPDGTQDPAA